MKEVQVIRIHSGSFKDLVIAMCNANDEVDISYRMCKFIGRMQMQKPKENIVIFSIKTMENEEGIQSAAKNIAAFFMGKIQLATEVSNKESYIIWSLE